MDQPTYRSSAVRHPQRPWVRVELLLLLISGLVIGAAAQAAPGATGDFLFADGFERGAGSPPGADTTFMPPTMPFGDLARELYSGENACQTGLDPAAIDDRRVAILTGRITDGDGAPLPAVTVAVAGRTEFGETLTDADGAYQLAVNGGAGLRVTARRAGFLPAQRRIFAGWNRYATIDDFALVRLDSAATAVSMDAPTAQLARANPVGDQNGLRTPTLLVPPGTTGSARDVDGTPIALSSMTVRVTEYTVGGLGPERMPASLPATTGYTHAFELSIDEVGPEGEVTFDEPVYYYVENYREFPVGGDVPTAFYDRDAGFWMPVNDGRIIAIVDVESGIAEIDVDGDGGADGGAALEALGFTREERELLAATYAAGTELWRVPIDHFTPWDCNWPVGPPFGAEETPPFGIGDLLFGGAEQTADPCEQDGTVIDCDNQHVGEAIELAGTELTLRYHSSQVPGNREALTASIPIVGPALPETLPDSVVASVEVAGRTYTRAFDTLTPGLSWDFTWDRRDALGRLTNSVWVATATVDSAYPAVYYDDRSEFNGSFGGAPTATIIGNDGEIVLSQQGFFEIGLWDARSLGLGGWVPGPLKALDVRTGRVNSGGGSEDLFGQPRIERPTIRLRQFAFGNNPTFEPSGTVLFTNDRFIFRTDPTGDFPLASDARERIAGNGDRGTSGNGGPASEAGMTPGPLAVADDGTIYFIDRFGQNTIRRITPEGIVEHVAGDFEERGSDGDGGLAVNATFRSIKGIAWYQGSLYVSDWGAHRIRVIGPDGIIQAFAGSGERGYCCEDGPSDPLGWQFTLPTALAVDDAGRLFVIDQGNEVIRLIRPGQIQSIAGGVPGDIPPSSEILDGVDGTLSAVDSERLSIAPDGSVYFEHGDRVLRRLTESGEVQRDGTTRWTVNRVAGDYEIRESAGDGGPPEQATFSRLDGVAVAPGGDIYLADRSELRWIVNPQRQLIEQDGEYFVPDENGLSIDVFDTFGRHVRIEEPRTRRVRFAFGYDEEGRLLSLRDPFGKTTTFDRPADDTVIVSAPDGSETELSLDDNGFLVEAAYPDGAAWTFEPDEDGLLRTLTDPSGNETALAYDPLGRLLSDESATGGLQSLARSEISGGFTVTLEDAFGNRSEYRATIDESGAVTRTVTRPNGLETRTTTGRDDLVTTTTPDGRVVATQLAPDPRFGSPATYPSIVTEVQPSGLTRTQEWTREALTEPDDPLTLLAQTDSVSVNGATFTSEYDAAASTLFETSPEGVEERYVLDGGSRLLSFEPPDGLAPTSFTYDTAGQLTRISLGDLEQRFAYDAAGRLRERSNAAGDAITLDHDARGNLTGATLPRGGTLSIGHDANGNPTSVTVPSGERYALAYSPLDQLTRFTPPDSAPYVIEHRADGVEASLTFPSGRAITRLFDAAGRYAGSTLDAGSTTMTYDAISGRPATASWQRSGDTAQQIAWDFDGSLPTTVAWTGPATGTYTRRFGANFRLVGLTFEGGPERIRGYDADSRIIREGPFTFEREGPARLVSAITDGTARFTETIDDLGRVAGRALSISGTEVSTLALTFEVRGKLASREFSIASQTRTLSYAFDADGQLTEVDEGTIPVARYEYDANGNRVFADFGMVPLTATFDTQDRIQSLGGTLYAHDEDGLLTAIGDRSFTYNAYGELLTSSAGGETVTYHYDALHRRVARTANGGTTAYFYGDSEDRLLVTASRDPFGVVSHFYYDERARLHALEREGQRFYVFSDQIGSPVAVFDDGGALVKAITRDPWGRVLSDSNPAFVLPIGFAGGLEDPDTGLVNFLRRDYDPRGGTFTTRDPLWFRSGTWNHYAYAGNDPVGARDRTGLVSFGAEYYAGIGAGFQPVFDENGWGLCAQAGFGFGAGVSVDPSASPETSLGAEGEISGNFNGTAAGFVIGGKVATNPCPDQPPLQLVDTSKLKGGIPFLTGTLDANGAGAELGGDTETGIGAGAKATLNACFSFSF